MKHSKEERVDDYKKQQRQTYHIDILCDRMCPEEKPEHK
jgi:hypothetical protein